jgi:hypothetical protein
MDKAAGDAQSIRNLADRAALGAQTDNSRDIHDDTRPSQCFPLGATSGKFNDQTASSIFSYGLAITIVSGSDSRR